MSQEIIFEGWKQIASALRCSERQAQRKFELVRDELVPLLKHYQGPGFWIKMDLDDMTKFKNLLFENAMRRWRSRGRRPRIMSDFVAVCQAKLFD